MNFSDYSYGLTGDNRPDEMPEYAKRYYIAYGSNLNKQQMRHRCPDAEPVGVATIEDYQLEFRRGVLTIEPKEGSSVPVGIWQISASDELALDRYEGYPILYYKQDFRVMMDGEEICAMAYIMTDGFPLQAPSREYFRTVSRGYDDFELGLEKWNKLFCAYMRAKGMGE